ncbi:MAG: hypothetical protein WCE20_17460 [Rhizomicrobium sp.]
MGSDESFERKSYANAVNSVHTDITLPLNVFVGAWAEFLFFESDAIFKPEFVAAMHDLLDAEMSHVCCLINLGATKNVSSEPPAMFLGRSIDPAYYMRLLRGNGAPDSWLYLVDRYICASDVGDWCIYCEKENDVAIIALRTTDSLNRFQSALDRLHAEGLEKICGAEGVFPFTKLTAEWRNGLASHYKHK